MKTVFLSTPDIGGGAARATHWLAKGMRNQGEDVSMFVQNKLGNDSWVSVNSNGIIKLFDRIRPSIDSLPLRVYKKRALSPWSVNFFPNSRLINRVNNFQPDIVNLHWVGAGFLPVSALQKIRAPLVWSLYDMWPFTGGCHYDSFCNQFTKSCGKCPQLKSNGYDLSSVIFYNKKKSWSNLNMTIVAPSKWLANEAKKSTLFKNYQVEVIPHGTDLDIFKPIDKRVARDILGLPQDAIFMLFGSVGGTADTRKGFQYLIPALNKISALNKHQNLQLMIFGSSESSGNELPFPVHYLGRLHDDYSLALLYSAADVTITPSLQEAFGMTASESMACGTPVVAFGAAGALDVVDHKINGYLAEPYSFDDLANGILWVLADKSRLAEISVASRKKAENSFNLKSVSRDYVALYQSILDKSRTSKK